MKLLSIRSLAFCVLMLSILATTVTCDRNPLTGSKLTLSNYNQVTTGMSKAQVEKILGPPTKSETIDMFVYKKTTYRYEEGKKFAIITFKNDQVDSKDTNLGTNP